LRLGFTLLIFGILVTGIILGEMSQTHASGVPLWVERLISWYNENKISEHDLVTALEFLSKNDIISLKTSEIQNILQKTPSKEYEIMVTNGLKHIVPLDKIKGGGPPKDGIPSIDDPQFATLNGSAFMKHSDIVIGLEINDQVKAYPLSILVWHEIVNDNVGGTPVAVTYCPLCFTNQVFERVLDGQEVEFGTSGKLYNSNLVMYDRLTDSYWSQALGTAITGELTGQQLKIIPFDVILWGDWISLHPETLVLTRDTGYTRAYSVDPYRSYYTEPRIIFPVDNKDDRMHLKEIILGFNEGEIYKAYKQSDIESKVVINDKINEQQIVLISMYTGNARAFDRNINGQVLEFVFSDGKIIDLQTSSEWSYDGIAISGELEGVEMNRLPFNPGFWFEWVAFHPETEIYENSENEK